MTPRARPVKAGNRFAKPKSAVRDARCAELHDPGFVAQVREHSAEQCFDLGSLQHLPPSEALAKLEYRCDMRDLTTFAGIPAFTKFAYTLGLADRVAGLPLTKRDSTYSPGKLCELGEQHTAY